MVVTGRAEPSQSQEPGTPQGWQDSNWPLNMEGSYVSRSLAHCTTIPALWIQLFCLSLLLNESDNLTTRGLLWIYIYSVTIQNIQLRWAIKICNIKVGIWSGRLGHLHPTSKNLGPIPSSVPKFHFFLICTLRDSNDGSIVGFLPPQRRCGSNSQLPALTWLSLGHSLREREQAHECLFSPLPKYSHRYVCLTCKLKCSHWNALNQETQQET